jgi:hypothetical protein
VRLENPLGHGNFLSGLKLSRQEEGRGCEQSQQQRGPGEAPPLQSPFIDSGDISFGGCRRPLNIISGTEAISDWGWEFFVGSA